MYDQFEIRSYGWQELAILYAPGLVPNSAAKRLTKWILIDHKLCEQLIQVGWKKGNRVLTPLQVRFIVDSLGQP